MDTSLFYIENLECSYDRLPENKVLSISSLQIPKGKLVFLLGASGCGKSTLLETLGLMNNTVASGKILLNANEGNEKINLPDLWNGGSASQLTDVRKRYYSFIFQNTNLMENFTAYENVCLSGMIKKNIPQAEVLESAKVLMNKIKLPETEVNLQTLAVNLSGGQRQRLAFVRALNNDATILFGDEPTGNLDEANANELFEIIRANLDSRLTAIVVSHDINLAVKYADQIVVITKEPGKNYGEVKAENIFNKESWKNFSSDEINSLKNKLRSFYKTDNEHKVGKIVSNSNTTADLSINYAKLFLKKEGKALLGKKKSNFFILSLILTFTFLAIGFANGSLDYLNKQLNDPFVNLMTINVPSSQNTSLKYLQSDLMDEDIKSKFLLNNATPYKKSPLRVLDAAKHTFNYVPARSVDVEEDAGLINEVVLEKGNVIHSKISSGFKDANDIGVIVTSNFLDEFGYPENTNFIYYPFTIKDKDSTSDNSYDIPVKVPVRAIVKRLPGKYGALYPIFFWKSLMYNQDNIFDSSTRNNKLNIFLETNDAVKSSKFGDLLSEFFARNTELEIFHPRSPIKNIDTVGFKAGYRYDIGFDSSVTDISLLNSLLHKIKLKAKDNFDTTSIERFFDYSGVSEIKNDFKYDELSVYFKRLDNIGAFKDYLLTKGNAKENADIIQLDDAKVKEKENYFFLSRVTYIISTLLVGFSTLAVCLFIFNLLVSHLAKVKMNIGTLKAIGLTDKESSNIYFKIILFFISIATFISFVLATAIGKIINYFFTNHKNETSNISYFKMLDFVEPSSIVNLIMLSAIFIILFCSILISRITIRKTLSKTPGDLIYNR